MYKKLRWAEIVIDLPIIFDGKPITLIGLYKISDRHFIVDIDQATHGYNFNLLGQNHFLNNLGSKTLKRCSVENGGVSFMKLKLKDLSEAERIFGRCLVDFQNPDFYSEISS